MKIIFLDCDGELTYSDYENEETANIDIEKVKLLKEICDKTDAKVVISSSWRGSDSYTPRIYYVLIDILTKGGDVSVNINISKKIFNEAYLPYLEMYDKRFEVYYGG